MEAQIPKELQGPLETNQVSSNRAAELVDQGSADDVVYIWISASQLIMSPVTSS